MARRGANGRSTIVKQADGRWHGFVSMGAKGDGTRDRRHVSAATRAAVVEKVKARDIKRDAGVVGATGRSMLVDEWLDLLGREYRLGTGSSAHVGHLPRDDPDAPESVHR